ncbi:ankyrin repeat domain-containing protein 42-like, partial [Diadema antillarum]|uniref:ankyrin repeat domain-containing protein 42-like n=1 Tax=Diadema antillarum TaxID=105358 RepID=UPI003A8B34EB
HVQNNAGETPMDVASRFAQLACVKLLKGDDSGSDFEDEIDTKDEVAAGMLVDVDSAVPISTSSLVQAGEIIVNSDNEVMADYADPEARQDRILQRSVDHGVEGESIPLSSRQKEEARGRALKRVEELERVLGIAKTNYHQLGGRLDEDREQQRRERESDSGPDYPRMIQELESQLEYERLRREKLESQLDECRAEIQHLNTMLERASNFGHSEEDAKPKKTKKKKKRPVSAGSGGVFIRRTISKPTPPQNLDLF